MNTKQKIQAEAVEMLRQSVKPGDTLRTVLRHVSKSGMSRRIDVFKLTDKSEAVYLTHLIAVAIGYSVPAKGEGLKIDGCGFDAGFEVVYSLGRTLWPNGDGKTVTGRNGSKEPETDGGYLLKQRWL